MKKHMTLGQLIDVDLTNSFKAMGQEGITIYEDGEFVNGYDCRMREMPVIRIIQDGLKLNAVIGNEREHDDYDLMPTKENMKSILDEAFGDWFESRKDELIRNELNKGDYDDEVIERYLSHTEWSSIDEMEELISDLRGVIEEIYWASSDFVK